jgi:PIN domain nuclease of toxin-antitoxin system
LAQPRQRLGIDHQSFDWQAGLKEPVVDLVQFQQNRSGIRLLPITLSHLELIETLPFHHKDPFDRLLIAQAQAENLLVVSVDAAFDPYGVNRLWLT